MRCPYCNSPTKVTNSRSHNNHHSVWRRRQCKNCQAIWSTDEQITLDTSHKILNAKNVLEPFRRDELYISIFDSLSHHSDQLTVSTALTETIIHKVLSLKAANVNTGQIITITYSVLNNFDKIAASVYKAKHS